MKPAPFDYERPTTLDGALEVMAAPGVVALAGGQSLVPLLARRRVRPRAVCDLNRVEGLAGVVVSADTVTVGAATRQRDVELDHEVASALPILTRAISTIGFVPVRHRGTIGGSLSYADPCAELPTAALLLDATLVLRRGTARREVAAADFFTGDYDTALERDELLVEARFPRLPDGTGFGAVKLRAAQDRAIGCMAAVTVADGVVTAARVAVFGGGGPSGRVETCETALLGADVHDAAAVEGAAAAGAERLTPLAGALQDHRHRQRLAAVAIRRAVVEALEGGKSDG